MILLVRFILFTYGEMWLLNKISCEIQILNEKVGKLMIENGELREEIKQLEIDKIHWRDLYWEECEKNKRLKELNKQIEVFITELEEHSKKLKSERDKWRGKYNRLKSEFNLLKNKIGTTKK